MIRSLALVSILTVGLATPLSAQQLTEPQARKIAEQLLQLDNKAWQDKSATEEAALYAEDAIRVYPKGTLLGRAAIEKWFSGPMTAKDWVQDPSTLDQVKVVSDNVIIFTGGWSGTWTGPKGPEVYKGRWAKTVVRDGDSWKAVLSVDNDEPHK
jgi:ketosteroid isomerase-like protein